MRKNDYIHIFLANTDIILNVNDSNTRPTVSVVDYLITRPAAWLLWRNILKPKYFVSIGLKTS